MDANTIRDFSQAIYRASQTADVVVLLLTKSKFDETVTEQWEELVSNTNSNSIWCIGASHSALSSVDTERMRSSTRDLLLYERVGVARISNDVKEELLQAVDRVVE